ncbi:S1 family peptidase [Acinetobacter pittii]|uniref:S1 family peptidase n=1 Tax=Acinetobacter pittii TaxID=48296 RepID=UPI001D0781FD|nr:serine protease [Acinetobacter pittii]
MKNSLLNHLQFSTIMLDPQPSGKLGTGFIVSTQHNGTERLFLVTNKHIVFQPAKLHLIVHKANEESGEVVEGCIALEPAKGSVWFKFDEEFLDIAILEVTKISANLPDGEKIYIQPIPIEKLATEEDYAKIGLLEDVYFFGYPLGIYDPNYGVPIARKAHLASDISKGFQDKHLFYFDGSLTDGMSGCPIYYLKETASGTDFLLLGIGYAQAQNPYKLSKGIVYEEPIQLGMANKAYVIKELINTYLSL